MLKVLKDLVVFFWQAKKWYLYPLLLIIILFGVVMVFAQSSALAPFIYTIF
ncbi:MAG: hypothetical protein HYV42_04885 [Candidatus Magasanikbacteria bacterium]|nr:hypothetical protein [Candidatus Magasanikbacteria bacterium]